MFSGAGGLSLGFEMAGFKVDLAIEMEENYLNSYRLNHPYTTALNQDITDIKCEQFDETYINGKSVKGIIGGPPCIGFSTVGNRRPHDPRNMLIFYFIKWVDYFRPNFYIMENVPGILSMAKGKVVKDVINMYNEIEYSCKMEILLATDYGVPQLRQRVFFIGSQDNKLWNFIIEKTHRKKTTQKKLSEKNNLPFYVTVNETISDILDIEPYTEDFSEDLSKDYTHPPKTEYQTYLRTNSNKLYEHFAPNHSKLVKTRISHIKQGENHSSLPEEYKLKSGYPNIYGRLHLNQPADTITGNCGCVSAPGRFIHPIQNRAISVREAARFQSFPDTYRFYGTMKDRYKQVGNAVPPLMANALANAIKKESN